LIAIAYFWNFLFPINKKLWTSSFVLHTVGLDCLVLGAVVFIMDKKPNAKWPRFFEIAGKNPLAIYLCCLNCLRMDWKRYMLVKPIRFLGYMKTALFIYLPAYWNSLLICDRIYVAVLGDWVTGWIKRRFISGRDQSCNRCRLKKLSIPFYF
jgi:predicted acyltransferase